MKRRPAEHAFTLIEITVVVAIIGLLVAGATIGVRAVAKSELRGAATRVAGAMRFAFDRAATSGRFYRLSFDLSGRAVVLEMSETRFLMERDERGRGAAKQEEERGAPPSQSAGGLDLAAFPRRAPAAFQAFAGAGYEPVKLGRAEIRGVWTPRYAEPMTEGTAHLYFFPQGFGEEAVVHLGDGDAVYSVVQHPLTGRVKVLNYAYEVDASRSARDDLGERVE